jgi:hypothetical protein
MIQYKTQGEQVAETHIAQIKDVISEGFLAAKKQRLKLELLKQRTRVYEEDMPHLNLELHYNNLNREIHNTYDVLEKLKELTESFKVHYNSAKIEELSSTH